jgi:hypothetical protein
MNSWKESTKCMRRTGSTTGVDVDVDVEDEDELITPQLAIAGGHTGGSGCNGILAGGH